MPSTESSRRELWKLAQAGDEASLQEVLDDLLTFLERVSEELGIFLPSTARQMQDVTSRARLGERSACILFPKD